MASVYTNVLTDVMTSCDDSCMNSNTAVAALMSETSTEVLRESALRLIANPAKSAAEDKAMSLTIAELMTRDSDFRAALAGMI